MSTEQAGWSIFTLDYDPQEQAGWSAVNTERRKEELSRESREKKTKCG
jgi:hypothetical protein